MRKTATYAVLLLSAMLAVSGCGTKDNSSKALGAETSPKPAVSKAPAESTAPSPTPVKLAAVLYFADSNMEKLVESNRTLTLSEGEGKYLAALNALKTPDNSDQLSLFKGFDFSEAELKDDQLTVDLTFGDSSRLGSGGEDLLLQALTNTLFQFPEVKTVQVLVDGEQVESLMGHVDLPHPIARNS